MEETHSFLLSSYLNSASPLSSLNSVDAVTTTLPTSPLLLLFLPSVEQGGGEGQRGPKSDDRIKHGILPFDCSMGRMVWQAGPVQVIVGGVSLVVRFIWSLCYMSSSHTHTSCHLDCWGPLRNTSCHLSPAVHILEYPSCRRCCRLYS